MPSESARKLTAVSLLVSSFLFLSCQDQSSKSKTEATGNSATSTAAARVTVDAARAHEHVRKLVELGPRPSGSPAIARAQEYISNELKSTGLKVIEDSFNGQTPRGAVPMKNLIAELPGANS